MSVSRRLGAVLRLSSGLLIILALSWIASAVATGPANHHLLNARAAHTATAQVDGSLVIAGGTGNRGVLKSLEFFDPVLGKSTQGPRLLEARSGHSAIALADGRVLLTGGRSGDNALLASSEIYDASGASLNPGASMGHARANHTSTLLADGRVLIVGGDAEGIAEIYDPATDRFIDAGRLAVARSGHSAVRLGDGRVLLVGGHDAAGATAEIFDPKTNTSSAVRGGLKTARVQPTLKLISDGKVQVYGGDAEITMEVYNPAGYFSSRGHLLRDSSVFRSIMYSPGQAALIAIPSAKGKHYAEDALGPAAGEFERSGHTATEVAARSTMVVVGGYGTTGAALDTVTELGSCGGTVTTDLTDYSPGQTVIMSGSGWTPGEQINLNLHRDTNDPPDTVLYATADENGDWINAEYLVQEFDLGVTFVLTATSDSGCVAQTTFTDSVNLQKVDITTGQNPNPVSSGSPASYGVTVTFTGNSNSGSCSAALSVSAGLPAGAGASFGALNPTTLSGAGTQTSTLTITTTAGTTLPGPYTFTVRATSTGTDCAGNGSATTTGTLVVAAAKQLTVTADDKSRAYGSANPALTYTITGLMSGDTVTGTASCATTATTSSVAGSYPITCTQGNLVAPGYMVNFVDGHLTVTKVQLTVTADDMSRAYGSANPSFTYKISGFVNSDPNSVVTGTANCSTTATTSSAAGSYPITCVQGTPPLTATNYTFNFVDGHLTVTKVQLTVTADDMSRAYGSANPSFTYKISGFVNSDPNSVVTGTANCSTTATTSSAAGSYPITCVQGTPPLTATNYTFNFVDGHLTVSKVQLTVTADDMSRAYGSANPSFTYKITGFVNSDPNSVVTGTANCSTTATTSSAAGSYPITCVQGTPPLTATNYTFNFVDGHLTVTKVQLTVTADDMSRAYGSANPSFTYKITGFVNSDPNSVVTGTANCSTTATTSSAAGSYPITCVQGTPPLTATNYTFNFVDGHLTVSKVQLTVTADDMSRAYGSANPSFTYKITGFVNSDPNSVVTGTANCSTTATTSSAAGSYPITCVQGTPPLTATNYTFNFVDGHLTVNPAPLTVTANNKSKTYGAPLPTLDAMVTGLVNGDSATPSCSTTALPGSPVGTYPIKCTLSDTNYTITFVDGTLTVNPAPLTVTANNKSKTYGAPLPTLDAMVTGLVNGDSATPSCSTTALPGSPVGTYPIKCTLSDTNYTITFVDGTLTVNPAPLTVTANNKSKTYGAPLPTLDAMVTGLVNGDSATPSCSTTALPGSPVGTYPIKCTLSDTNYTITFVDGTLTVNPAPLTVTANNKSKTYGAPLPTLDAMVTGLVNGDSATPSCSTTALPGSPVGTYPIKCTLSDTNYTITFVDGTLTVNPAPLTVTANNKSKTYGAPLPTLDAMVTGLVNGDSATPSCSTTALPGSPVGTYPIKCTLSDTNYTITFVDGTLTVNPAPLTVTANNKSKTYGAPLPTLDAMVTGLVNGDSATPSCSTTALPGSPVGTYPIKCTLSDTNYTITFVDGTLTVNPAPLTVTANNKSKTYGAPLPTLDAMVTGLVNGDSATPSCSTTALPGSPVGTYPIKCTLSDTNYTITFVDGTLTVNPALLTVTAGNKSKVYGSPNPMLTYTITGFVNGENSGVVSGAASCSTTATATSGVGPYPINCTGNLSAANYTFTFSPGTLTITPALLTVTAGNKSKVYGSPNPMLTYTITGFVNGDTIAVVGGTASCSTVPPGSGVGNYPITCTQDSLAATNYTFMFVDGTLTITRAQLTLTATSTSKHFGDPNPVFAYTFSGFVNGDVAATAVTGMASCTTTALQFSVVSPPTFPITCTIGSLSAANYTFTFVGGTLTITARSALVNYIGQQTFVTSGSSSTTAQVTLSASVQDPTGLGLSGAKVDFIDATLGGTGKALATGVPVSPVQNALFTGTANVIVTLSTGQYGAQSYQIRVQMTGNYSNALQPQVDKTATVVVVQPPASYQTTGGGILAGLSAAGAYAGNGANFSVGLSYTSKLTNLKGQISLTIPQADGNTVYVKSNSLSSMAVTGTDDSQSATIYAKSNMIEVINGTTVTIDGNVTLRMDVTEGKPGNLGSVGFTVLSSKDSSLYYSNNWQSVPPTTPPGGQNVWKTVPENFTGTVMISD